MQRQREIQVACTHTHIVHMGFVIIWKFLCRNTTNIEFMPFEHHTFIPWSIPKTLSKFEENAHHEKNALQLNVIRNLILSFFVCVSDKLLWTWAAILMNALNLHDFHVSLVLPTDHKYFHISFFPFCRLSTMCAIQTIKSTIWRERKKMTIIK